MDFLTLIQLLDSTVRLATPLLLACLAGLFSERAGIFDIGLEGKMLAAAFFSAAVAAVTGSVWLGLLAGIVASLLLSALHGIASITFRGNQLISGVAINFLASGLTVLIAQSWFQQGGRTPSLMGGGRFTPITLPFADAVADVPFVGPIYAELISGHSILVYMAFAAVPLTWFVLFRTRFGLRLRAVGENPPRWTPRACRWWACAMLRLQSVACSAGSRVPICPPRSRPVSSRTCPQAAAISRWRR